MKIYNPSISKQQLGGGHTFRRTLETALAGQVQFVDNLHLADVLFISGVTLVDKNEVYNAKRSGKKIILRVDNMPRKSRNQRMSPHERMKEYAQMATHVVYQSEWAQKWIGSYLGITGEIIYNAADESIFYPHGFSQTDYKTYLIMQYNRDENKRITEAFDLFTQEWLQNNKNKLKIIGNFSPELVAANFDFFRGENVEYHGILDNPLAIANVMRNCDTLIYPTYSDACPNTVIESLMCGLDVLHTGWPVIQEIMKLWDEKGREYFSLKRLADDYLALL